MEMTRGKHAVRASLAVQSFQKKKRTTPVQDAEFWCKTGLDRDGFMKQFLNNEIGFGIFATQNFRQGDFLLEYVGTRISTQEAERRNTRYARHQKSKSTPRCYMYYFKYKKEEYCIDATKETQRLAKFANDAPLRDTRCNAKMKLNVFDNDYPRLCLFAIKDIKAGDEVRYDYGEDKKLLFWRTEEKKCVKVSQTDDSDDDPFDVESDRRGQTAGESLSSNENDSDDDPFDEELDRRGQTLGEPLSSSERENDLCDLVDVSDGNDPDYAPLEKSDISSSDGELCDYGNVPDSNKKDCEETEVLRESQAVKITTDVSDVEKASVDHGSAQSDTDPLKTINDQLCHKESTVDMCYLVHEYRDMTKKKAPARTMTAREAGMLTDSEDETDYQARHAIDAAEEVIDTVEDILYAAKLSMEEVEEDDEDEDDEDVGQEGNLTCQICSRVFKKKGALTTHFKSHEKSKDKTYKKPQRPCFFCKVSQSQLNRHLIGMHSTEAVVKEALSFPEKSQERKAAFAKIRKLAISHYNEDQSALPEPTYMSERQGYADVQCSKCKGFYGGRLFYRHKELCAGDSITVPRKIKVNALKQGNGEFETEILSRFHDNEIGRICRNDSALILIGRSLYQKGKGKVCKEMEVRKSVMNDMRLLATLYLSFLDFVPTSQTLEDMFVVKNFDYLEQAIECITKKEGKLKHGVKNSLKYLLLTAQDKLVGIYSKKEDDDKVRSLERFLNVLKLHSDTIFADATFAINFNRQEKLRMPEQQAEEAEVEKLGQHIKHVISEMSSEFTFIERHEYVSLRDSVCSRLTLFNARRGGEPSRLKMTQYTDAMAGRWINDKDVEQIPEFEKQLFSDMHLAYQVGKGNHLVPVLIPTDCIKGLEILIDAETRKRIGILETNPYLFPNTSYSQDHVIGWNCTNKMCLEANVEKPEKLTASKQRHRISTIYSAFEVPETERQYFYKHMGHSKEVNTGTYQYPLSILEVTKVGRHLQDIDRGMVRKGQGQCTYHNDDVQAEDTADDESDQGDQPVDTTEGLTGRSETLNQKEYIRDIPQAESSGTDQKSKRDYFRWTDAETAAVKEDFKVWINVREGNKLPSTRERKEYIKKNKCRFDNKTLRTKIMNEQNARQKLIKDRMSKMSDKH